MKEKRTVYIVEKDDCIFKVFDTLAEAKIYMLHEYLKWADTTGFHSDEEELDWFIKDIRSIDEHAYVEDMFYLHRAEYCSESENENLIFT